MLIDFMNLKICLFVGVISFYKSNLVIFVIDLLFIIWGEIDCNRNKDEVV